MMKDREQLKALWAKTNAKRAAELGMPVGTAHARLKRALLFRYIEMAGENACFRCGSPMTVDDYSIDHKEPWIGGDLSLFWNLDNLAFSHAGCNARAARKKRSPHGAVNSYYAGCRCQPCTTANTNACLKRRRKKRRAS